MEKNTARYNSILQERASKGSKQGAAHTQWRVGQFRSQSSSAECGRGSCAVEGVAFFNPHGAAPVACSDLLRQLKIAAIIH